MYLGAPLSSSARRKNPQSSANNYGEFCSAGKRDDEKKQIKEKATR